MNGLPDFVNSVKMSLIAALGLVPSSQVGVDSTMRLAHCSARSSTSVHSVSVCISRSSSCLFDQMIEEMWIGSFSAPSLNVDSCSRLLTFCINC